MKKIFYSIMAVALCACSQSEVDDNTGIAPQPENNGVTFTVVDNGFVGEDGTRVTYGDGVSYAATFEEGDQIGVYGITAMEGDTPTAYKFENKPLTLTNGVWKSSESLDLTDVKLLFAYAPYRPNASTDTNADYKLTFTGSEGSWDVNTDNNRFFVGGETYSVTDNSGENFELNDWMGAAANVTAGQTEFTFNMKHMRGMVELTTHKDVVLEDLMLEVAGNKDWRYHFTPYHIETADKHVYRILTTEYRNKNTVYATIKDVNITKKYKKAFSDNSVGAGKCVRVNIDYTPTPIITVSPDNLATILTEKYGTNYATAPDPAFTSLRLAGTLSEADWATLKSLTTLKTLDMYQLANTEIPYGWLNDAPKLKETLTTLILPNKLETIPWNSLQVQNVANIDIPATVTTIGDGAFYYCEKTSFCIPANSQLVTIGDGAFWNAKDVYTDAIGVLKMPASVTSIAANAFLGVKDMNKIIFQSTAAPAITNGKNQTIENNVLICVPNSDNYKNQSLFPGNAVFVNPLPLTAGNYTAITTGEGSMADLCDGIIGDNESYWHSSYTGATMTYDKWGIYIDIALPTEQNSLKVFYTNRNHGNNFYAVRVAIGVKSEETEDYTEVFRVESGLPTGYNAMKVLDSTIAKTDGTSYKYVRFAFLETVKGTAADQTIADKAVMATLSELTLAEDAWIE